MKLSKPLFWLITVLWFGAAIFWYMNSSCSSCNTTVAAANTAAIPQSTPALSIVDSNWQLRNDDNLRFAKSSEVPIISPSVSTTLDSLSRYEISNSGKSLTVTGYYSSAEKNNTHFENLGLARADTIKKIMVGKGVAENNIATKAELNNTIYFTPTDTLVGGISFNFAKAAPVLSKEEKLLFEPRTVYFNTGKNSLIVTPELATYLRDADKYLKAHPEIKLQVTGYTDNVGDPAKNIQLSEARAQFVKSELVKKGLTENQLSATGKGMADPIADNSTADGRAKNRHVTIALQ